MRAKNDNISSNIKEELELTGDILERIRVLAKKEGHTVEDEAALLLEKGLSIMEEEFSQPVK